MNSHALAVFGVWFILMALVSAFCNPFFENKKWAKVTAALFVTGTLLIAVQASLN